MTFKLTAPQDELDGEMGEFLSDRVVKLGLKGDVFKAMGYTYRGGRIDARGEHMFWYRNVERDRFASGALYYELTFDKSKKLTSVRQITPILDTASSAVTAMVADVVSQGNFRP